MYFSRKNKVIIGMICVIIISFLVYNNLLQAEEPIEFNVEAEDIVLGIINKPQIPEEERSILVDVKGAVNNPGVYQMNEGDRVIHAIIKAGGATEEADLDQINLAEKVYDQLKIKVPKLGEEIEEAKVISNGKININRATVSELTTLTGIGEAKAQAIVKYRQKNGNFSSIEEIMKVTGIAEKTFEQIKDDITI